MFSDPVTFTYGHQILMDTCSFFCSPFSLPQRLIPRSHWVFPSLWVSSPSRHMSLEMHSWLKSQEPWEPHCWSLPLRKRWRRESMLVLRAPITKHHGPGGLKQQKLSYSSGGQESEIKVLAGPWSLWGSREASVPGFLPASGGCRWPLPWGLIPLVSASISSRPSSPCAKSLSF